jgi:ATP-grasp domain-containing protein/L-aminoacid ligase-like protein
MQSRWLWCDACRGWGLWGLRGWGTGNGDGDGRADGAPGAGLLKRVLVFATTTGYQTRAFGEAADALGVDLVFATDRCHKIEDPWRDGAIAIRFHEEDRSVRRVVDEAMRRRIDGVIVVGDRPTVIAARVAERLGLPYHGPEAAAVARDKLRTRQRLHDAGLPAPWFRVFSAAARASDVAASLPAFPCVVKPVALSGSRGVMRADDADAFAAAFARLQALLASADIQAERNPAHETVLVEAFIPGREFALEGLMHDGRLHVLALFDKPDPLDGPFFEETIYVTPSRAPASDQRAIVDAIDAAARAIGLAQGPVHAECRVNERGVYVIEIAARPIGGLCARALRFERSAALSNHDGRITAGHEPRIPNPESRQGLEHVLLRHALGDRPDAWRRESDASGVMMMPIARRGVFRSVEGVDDAASVEGITDVRVTAKPDQLLVPLPEGASYLGFIFARAETSGAVDRALREAHGRLRFHIDAPLTVLGRGQLH